MNANQLEVRCTTNRFGEPARAVFDKSNNEIVAGPYLMHVSITLLDLPYRYGPEEAAVKVYAEGSQEYTHFI